ncbi:MAG: PQQ-like beta-propeller repeat protein, partial [Chloracidobacterium sp.]|nr:PQQ-like beta-propeller repeat protein [Chloracidobacterium sp.]
NPPPRASTPPRANSSPPQPARPNPANPPGGQFGAGPFLVYALSSDGMLHSLHLSNGADYEEPVKFLPPGASAEGLIVVDNVAYVVTHGNCGGVANGLWAIDLVSKQITTWKANVAGIAGAAFGGDGTIYITTGSGGESPNSVVALDPKTLSVKDWYTTGESEFSSTPLIFEHKGKTLVAAATRDGRVRLLDGAHLGGADHRTALFTTPATSNSEPIEPGALSSWQDASGARWILEPVAGSQSGAVVAWKFVNHDGAPVLERAWTSRDLVSPPPPTIINGVVFVTSSGEYHVNDSKMNAAERARRSSGAVIYALDGETGKELWSSGTTITSFSSGGALSGGAGQIYLTTYDGMVYAFGFPMEH